MNRREAIQCLGLGGISAGCCALGFGDCRDAPTERATLRGLAVDAHCHVFNARDLPARSFILGTQFAGSFITKSPALSAAAEFIIDAILELFKVAPDAAAELEFLGRPSSTNSRRRSPLDAWDAGVSEFLQDVVADAPPGGPRAWAPFYRPEWEPQRHALRAALRQSAGTVSSTSTGSGHPRIQIPELPGERDLRVLFDWCRQLCNYRLHNVDRLMEILGPEQRGPGIFLPALVDLHRWLPDITMPSNDRPSVSLPRQVEVMEAIAELRPGVHPFLGVCPLAEWQETESLLRRCFAREDESSNGFAGVKLYPPMGFVPLENGHLLAEVATRVDANLRSLYAFCVEHDVPVMAHCNASKETTTGMANGTGLAEKWEPVLEEFPSLRINLAHFGSVASFRAESVAGRSPLEQEKIAELMERGQVFADVADDTTPSNRADRPGLIEAFESYFERHPRARNRLMYGSDWILLGFEGDASLNYLGGWSKTFDAPGLKEHKAAFFGANALEFLGMTRKSRARSRMEKFYQRLGREAAWLPELEGADAG